MSSIILDFDGTVADSLPLVLDLFYKWSGRPEFSKTEVERYRGMQLKEILAEMRIPVWKVPQILAKNRSEFGRRISEVSVFAGIPEALRSLHNRGHKLYIVSTNSTHNVTSFLKGYDLEKVFEAVHGNVGVFGKTAAIRSIIKKHKLNLDNCFSIGDEVRDIEAAKKAGIKSVAVGWGYNSQKILEHHKPNYFVSNPADLVKLLQ